MPAVGRWGMIAALAGLLGLAAVGARPVRALAPLLSAAAPGLQTARFSTRVTPAPSPLLWDADGDGLPDLVILLLVVNVIVRLSARWPRACRDGTPLSGRLIQPVPPPPRLLC